MQACPGTLAAMRLHLPLGLEIAAARGVAALSRRAGRGGGTTLPGKLLWKLDPGAIDRLAARLPRGSVLVSATNGKTTTAAMAAEILRPRTGSRTTPPARTSSRASPPRCSRAGDAELGLFEVDEAALPEVVAARAAAARLPRQPLPRPARPLRRARARRRALARRGRRPARGDAARRATPTTRSSRRSARRTRAASPSASTTRGVARPALQHAADSKYCVRCGTPYDYAAAYVGHLGDYRCPNCGHARPPLDVAARDDRPARARRLVVQRSTRPKAHARSSSACPASTTSTTRSRRRRSPCTLGRGARRDRRRARALLRGVRPLRAHRGRRQADPHAADQEPGRRERGGADARGRRRTQPSPSSRSTTRSPTAATSRGSGTSTSSRSCRAWRRSSRAGAAPPSSRCASAYGGLDRGRDRGRASTSSRALDRGLELTPEGGELVVLPTYTAMLALQRTRRRRAGSRSRTGSSAA